MWAATKFMGHLKDVCWPRNLTPKEKERFFVASPIREQVSQTTVLAF